MVSDVWLKKIRSFDYHWASIDGRVWTSSRVVKCGRPPGLRTIPGRWLQPDISRGRERFVLQEHGKIRKEFVHRLVALAWIGPPPFAGAFVLHADDDPTNNHASNLRWGTQVENMEDRYKNGRYYVQGIKSFQQLRSIYLASKSQSVKEVASQFGVSENCVWGIKSKTYWSKVTNEIDKE